MIGAASRARGAREARDARGACDAREACDARGACHACEARGGAARPAAEAPPRAAPPSPPCPSPPLLSSTPPAGSPDRARRAPRADPASLAAPPDPAPRAAPPDPAPRAAPYDKRRLSYAATFGDARRARLIRAIEWGTGKARLLRRIRRFEARGVPEGHAFWGAALAVMGIEVRTPEAEIARLPARGPLVVVANHPHGLVDGMVMAELIGRARPDYRILARSLLTGVEEVARYTIPVPFSHEPDAREKGLAMRREASAHLAQGGCVALFPAGAVAGAESLWGPAVEPPWSPFTANLIIRARATVVPMRFAGSNSRAYLAAGRLSATLRQGLLLHEVARSLGRPQRPVIGHPIPPEAWAPHAARPRAMMAWLRQATLALAA